MFERKKQTKSSARARQSTSTLNDSFGRNNVVVSKSQRELAQRQQSVTQRQHDIKRASLRRQARTRLITVIAVLFFGLILYRMNITGVSLATNASSKLSSEQRSGYEAALLKLYRQHTVAGQAWLFDESAFNKDLLDKFPEIEHATMSSSAPLSSSVNADIRFRRPVFTWRDATQTNQFVDKNGVLFAKNLDSSTNTKKLIRIEDQSGVVLEEGTSVLTEQLIQFVGQLHSKVPPIYGAGNTVARVIIPKSTREVQIQISNQPYLIKFSSTRSLDEQVGELAQVLAFLKQNKVVPSASIDLRVAHKAFYK